MSDPSPFSRLDEIFEEQLARLALDHATFPAQYYLFRGDEMVASVERQAEGDALTAFSEEVAILVAEHNADGFIEVTKGLQAKLPPESRPDSTGRVVERPGTPLVWRPFMSASAHVKGTDETAMVTATYEASPTGGIRELERTRYRGSDGRYPGLEPILRVWTENSNQTTAR